MPRTSRIDSNGIDGGIIFIRWQPQERQRKLRTAIHGLEHMAQKGVASPSPPLTATSPGNPSLLERLLGAQSRLLLAPVLPRGRFWENLVRVGREHSL